jgi:hypothetical protein
MIDLVELIPKFDGAQSFYRKAFCRKEYEDGREVTALYSYDVRIATIDCRTQKIRIAFDERWDSQTTLRHIKEFIRQQTHGGKLTKDDLLKFDSLHPVY